ncbi:hypothetical protein [Cytophaga aurantiaca]|uniref:hypothetical protein n=1 Tax=Cytophaga aurantiaca TaxID=29530 RepID=UPI000364FA68|nr:hypothetical protein [Cytophaga aurantiaca]
MLIVLLIGFLVVLFSSFVISSKVYKELRGKGDAVAVSAAILCFIVSFLFMGFVLFRVCIGESFSRT